MALTDPKNTLSFAYSRLLTTHRDMREVSCASVAKQLKAYMASPVGSTKAQPETEALYFYGLNHAVSVIASMRAPLEPLTQGELDLVNLYHHHGQLSAVRAFYYLLWICTREARHNQSLTKDGPKIAELFGASMQDFFLSITGGEATISSKFISNPPAGTIGTYCRALQWQFYKSKWNSSYGGPAWGAITDCLVRFVEGEYTAEMMLDTIFTLCHNNGSVFNKVTCYHHYSATLAIILDVQRSGQIPEYILGEQCPNNFVPLPLFTAMASLRQISLGAVGSYVDWFVVEALGSVSKYPAEKHAQVKKHGMSAKASEAEKKAIEKADEEKKNFFALQKAEAEKQALFEKDHIQIDTDTWVKKTQIARAA